MGGFAHLHVHSHFSFLDGASSVEALVKAAAELGMEAIALTDHDNLCAAARFARVARRYGIKPIHGAEVVLEDGGHLLLLAEGPRGYSNICTILTEAHMSRGWEKAPEKTAEFIERRLAPKVSVASLEEHREGIVALSGCARGSIPALIRAGRLGRALELARRYVDIFGRGNFLVELQDMRIPGNLGLLSRLHELAGEIGAGVVATNDVHYCSKGDFAIHDVLTCIRTLTRLDDVHPERRLNAENYLKPQEEMALLFHGYPEAIRAAGEIAERCEPGLLLDRRLSPDFVPPEGTSGEYLRHLVYEGARSRYGTITSAIRARLDHELDVICALEYEDYFLMVWDVVAFARQRKIRFAGRGSAADSAVAYCLFITDVDSIARGLLFERFLSLERAQKPDIDIDFDARRRDEVRDYLQRRYGPERVATVCTFNTFQARSAVRDVGKAMGFPPGDIDRLAKRIPHMCADEIGEAIEKYPELRGSGIPFERYSQLFDVCRALAGAPRHIGTHLGGVVVSRIPLATVTPLEMAARGVVITQFDKDDVEEVGLIKLDLLSLRMLAAVEDSVRSSGIDYQRIPLDDKATYEMLNAGDTIGAFQLESPAQRALQSRLGASAIEDIVASVALIRPGPVQGNMVEPFIARRRGLEEVTYVHPSLERILGKTYGVVLYQEQVIEIATAVAGFTPGESDRLRKVMTHYRSRAEMDAIGKEFLEKATEHGTPRAVAETVLSYIVGYAGYGFCEAHAAAFADTAYKTSYLLRHFPAEFYTAILNCEPMGFYPPNTICVEARRRGIRILPVDINRSAEGFAVEAGAIRVGLLKVRGMNEEMAARIVASRKAGGYVSIEDFCARVPVDRALLENLVLCGAFDSLHPNRRAALWEIPRALRGVGRGGGGDPGDDRARRRNIPDFSEVDKFKHEFYVLGLHPTRHPVEFYRARLIRDGVLPVACAKQKDPGALLKVAGLVIRPHRPPTRSGRIVVFLSLEDETGLIDVTVFEDTYRACEGAMFTSPMLVVEGHLDRRANMPSITASFVRGL